MRVPKQPPRCTKRDEGLPALTESEGKQEQIPKAKTKNYPQRGIQLQTNIKEAD